ncbi:MAG: hypothetical protein M3Q05_13070, partial [Bacteroidota bacterium]|nr:hypothetical protein [Bacteroidota bacterium]
KKNLLLSVTLFYPPGNEYMIQKLLYFNLINCFYLLLYIQQSPFPVNYIFVTGLIITICYNGQLLTSFVTKFFKNKWLVYPLRLLTILFGSAILFYAFPPLLPGDKVIFCAISYYLVTGAIILWSGFLPLKFKKF